MARVVLLAVPDPSHGALAALPAQVYRGHGRGHGRGTVSARRADARVAFVPSCRGVARHRGRRMAARQAAAERRNCDIRRDVSAEEAKLKPLIIGIAGGTGSGKTTVAQKLAAAMPPERCVTIEHDSYYRDRSDLDEEERKSINYDHPSSLESELLAEHLAQLRAGFPVEVPIYDFITQTRRPERRLVHPVPVIIVEGILVFAEPLLREHLDIKIFVDTDADVRLIRRIRRDLEHRGRTFTSVREQYYHTVRPMHLAFVEPSKRWADLIIPEGGDNRIAIDVLLGRLSKAAYGTP